MKLSNAFSFSLNFLFHSKIRSFLTIIGIIIGIGAVVMILSITEGAKKQLEERLSSFGADIITITPGFSRARGGEARFFREPSFSSQQTSGKNLTLKDVLTIKSVENVKLVSGEISLRGEISYLNKKIITTVRGVDILYWKDLTTEKILAGRYLSPGDEYNVVIGSDLIKNSFSNEISLNKKINIEGVSFTVVGITNGGNNVYIPIHTARKIFKEEGNEKFDLILVKVEDVQKINETVNKITSKLLLSRGILNKNKQDFSITNPSAIQSTVRETMNSMTLFLGAIAAISLLVGGIGIANTMFTSVLEKTKDIGIMKAIGASNKDILLIFLLNSSLIGFVGGIGGIILGVFASDLLSYVFSSDNIGFIRNFGNSSFSLDILIGSLVLSIFIGAIAGMVPAYKASKLNPIEALRYE
ncbi:MAG: ABC transporter permease [Candidatus Pacearchaeota archaeon]